MKILWFTWKDKCNPLAGGAEQVNEELASRMVKDGHEVTLIVGGFPNCLGEEIINGYKVIRLGNQVSLYWLAYKYYKKNLKGWADIIIEEINTVPFFTSLYAKEPKYLLFYQLCREVWFHQMFFPASLIGYLIEPIYVFALRKNRVLTISNSTKKDLLRYKYSKDKIKIFPLGIEIKPIRNLSEAKKFKELTLLSLGAIRPMKRALDQVKAFELAKKSIPSLKLKIAGGGKGKYYDKVMAHIENSPYKKDIEYLGFISREKKQELMRRCHIIMVASVKEGWGLITTEANSQGTPAVVYNVDGLRDSVKNNKTGFVSKENNPEGLAQSIVKLCKNKKLYNKFQSVALEWSKTLTFSKMYEEFMKLVR